MHDLREVFEMVTKQTEPDLDSWKKQEDRQRSRSRNRRIGAIVVAAAAAIAIGVFSLLSRPGAGTTSVTEPPTPSVPFVTSPPIGAQLVAPDGTPLRQFPGSFSEGSSLQLSPDGTTLAYMFAGYVHTVRVDGSDDRTLTGAGNTNDGDAQNHVVWSPDGSQLAYAYTGNIYVMNCRWLGSTRDHAFARRARRLLSRLVDRRNDRVLGREPERRGRRTLRRGHLHDPRDRWPSDPVDP